MTEQEKARENKAKIITNYLSGYRIITMKNAEIITKKFLELSIDPCYTQHERTNRYRGAFDIIEAMYNCGVIPYSLCVELEKRINDNNAMEILKERRKHGSIKKK